MLKVLQFYSIITSYLDRSSAAKRYIWYSAIMGILGGGLGFGEVIARKSLGASSFQVTLLAMSTPIAAFSSLWWANWIEGRDQRKILMIVGIIGFMIIATGGWLSLYIHLLAIHFFFHLGFGLFGPSENRILQQHIASKSTGRTFGNASVFRVATAAIAAFAAGYWMEHSEMGYRQVYPLAAFAGLVSLLFITSIPTLATKANDKLSSYQVFIQPIKDVFALLRVRRDYLRFEMAFMLYGIAFMMILPVIPLFLVDDLQLRYDQIGLARGLISQVVMLFAIPVFGYLFDRSTPHRLAVYIFFLLSFFPILLVISGNLEGSMQMLFVYISFAFFGITMSGVHVLWSLSSIRFAAGKDAGVFHSVHIAATGVRGAFAPLLGYLIMTTLGTSVALICSSAVFMLASIMMFVVRNIDKKRGEFHSLRPN